MKTKSQKRAEYTQAMTLYVDTCKAIRTLAVKHGMTNDDTVQQLLPKNLRRVPKTIKK